MMEFTVDDSPFSLTEEEIDFLLTFPRAAGFDEVQCLTRYHLLEESNGIWQLTQRGKLVSEAARQKRQKDAEDAAEKANQEAQRVRDRKQDRRDIWLVAIISAGLTAVFAFCLEHFKEILIALRQFFHF